MILDTSVLIGIFKKGKNIKRELVSYANDVYGISVATYIELLIGFLMKPTKSNIRHKEEFEFLIQKNILCLYQIDKDVADIYSAIQVKCMKTGKQIGVFDGIIAATAISRNMHLATLDSDFQRVEGLQLITP
jgi:predicted nucleic acid-binding protein